MTKLLIKATFLFSKKCLNKKITFLFFFYILDLLTLIDLYSHTHFNFNLHICYNIYAT